MNNNRYSISIRHALMLLVLLLGLPSWGYAQETFEQDGVKYSVVDDGTGRKCVKVAGSSKEVNNVVIPRSVRNYEVIAIGAYAFQDCSGLTSVTIPEGVTSIGAYAFQDCSGLTSITIPEGVTSISKNAFEGCSGLTSVTIPNRYIGTSSIPWGNLRSLTVYGISPDLSKYIKNTPSLVSVAIEDATSIDNSFFEGCSSLTSVSISGSVTSIGERAFWGCSGLTSVTIPEGVTSIGERAFAGCSSLTSVTIPEGVTSIGVYAFQDCSGLTSVTIPESVTSIGERGFRDCSGLTSVTIPNRYIGTSLIPLDNLKSLTVYGVSQRLSEFIKKTPSLVSVVIENATSIDNSFFRGCKWLTSVSISGSVTSIGEYAFLGCSGLTSVTIPESVTSIGVRAFDGCSGLTSVTIPESVTSIGEYAFAGCSSLTSITIPESVTSIGQGAFDYCLSLTSVTIPEGVTSMDYGAFWGCSGLTSVTILEGVTSIGEKAFAYCSGLTSVTIPESVTSIGDGAFVGCSSLTSLAIPNSVTTIGDGAFAYCSGLTSVTIPEDVTSIGSSAFERCSSLTSVSISGNVTSIGENAFKGSSSLTSFSIPKSVTTIGKAAFKDCAALQSIQIHPERIESIGNKAFWGCSSLTSPWEFLNSNMTIADSAFIGCTSLKKIRLRREVPSSEGQFAENMVVYVPMGSVEKYQNILPQCTIYGDYVKTGQECKDLLSMYDLYNQNDFRPLVDVESDAPWTENNVLTDASQLSANFADEYEGSLGALVDSSDDSYFLSAWDADNPNEDYHYIQADLKKGCKAFKITFKRRENSDALAPTKVHVFVTNTSDDDNSWIDLGSDTLIYNDLTASINANYHAKVRYVRLQVEATADNAKENGNLYFALNKLDITPCRVNTPILKWDDGIYYAVKNNSFENGPSQVGNFENYLKGLTNGQFGDNSTPDKLFFKLQLAKPLKYVVVKYVKNNVNPTQSMLLNADDEKNRSFTFDADYRYYNNTTGIYCGQFQQPTDVISLWSKDKQSCYLRTAHIYTRPPKADLMSEDARTSIKDMLSQYDDKDFIGKDVFDALQSYCNEITRLAQTGRFVDFARNEYSTFYADYPAVVPMLVKAGIVKEQNGELVVDYIYNEGDVIPANTGVILKGNCMGNAYVMEKAATDATSAASPEGNLLHGTINDEETYVDGCSRYYMLSYDKATDCRLGFYWKGENGPQPFINKAYKAYLAIPDTYSAMGKESFSLADMEEFRGDITPISSLSDDKGHVQGNIYGIDGRKVINKDLKKLPSGLYIVNGKKVVVK